MVRSASRFMALAVPALALSWTSCGKNVESGSEVDAVAAPYRVGDASARHGDPEVLIYYANETAPDADEKANWDSILASLKSDERTAFMAESLETDLTLFPLVVDDETAVLKDYFCTDKNKLGVSLVIFTNRLVRSGMYEYCAAGQPAQVKTDTYMGKFRSRTSDFRALSSPLADKETLRWALTRTRLLFDPKSHIYSFVMKSHGNSDYVLTPRLHVNSKKISRRGLLDSLKATMSQSDAADGPALRRFAHQDGPTLDEVRKESEALQRRLAQSEEKLEKLLRKEIASNEALREALVKNELVVLELVKNELIKNELIKNELVKNELVKNELVKNELVKNELIKNELIKNELVKNELVKNELVKNELIKNELVKNELIKNELIKNELIKNELVKNELVKNELVKNELIKNELIKNELIKNELIKNELTKNELAAEGATAADGVEESSDLAKAVLPRIGVTKREFLEELASASSRTRAANDMHFSVVFTEACRSVLSPEVRSDIARSKPLKIDYLASSDEGSVKYKNIDYAKFLESLDESKSFGENLKDELTRVAEASQATK